MYFEDKTRVLGMDAVTLEISLPDGGRQSFDLAEQETVLGRAQECHVVLMDEKVSRRHALIRRADAELIIEDQGSANGVLVNGRRVQSQALAHGDRITLGQCEITVTLGGGAAPSEGTVVQAPRPLSALDTHAPAAKRPAKAKVPAAGKPLPPAVAKPAGSRRRLLAVAGGAGLAAVLLVGLLSLFSGGPSTPPAPAPSPAAPTPPPVPAPLPPALPQAGVPAPPAAFAPPPAQPVHPAPGQYPPPPPTLMPPTAPPAAAPPAGGPSPQAQAKLYHEQGQVFYDAGRLPDAVAAFSRAAALDPGNQLTQVKLQKAKQELLQRADEAFNRGLRNYQYLNYEQAVQDWMQVLHLLPDPNDPLHRKAREYIEQARVKLQR